ncbi:MAG: hypothetical protein ACRDRS_15180 [Pseudonocardiaceae bacterium]
MQNEVTDFDISEFVDCIGDTPQKRRDITLPVAPWICLRKIKSAKSLI